eukprot:TRINITY_DN52093_c0_g1_i1.p1 TRINITY_DN52093_c0_g1~~TRINITY_DN52093_c0_g1_i1.p1  ORF type:complete len:341 (+),score=46.50 TRINITY_DN52093_c0_g1_i1:78-1100(+)
MSTTLSSERRVPRLSLVSLLLPVCLVALSARGALVDADLGPCAPKGMHPIDTFALYQVKKTMGKSSFPSRFSEQGMVVEMAKIAGSVSNLMYVPGWSFVDGFTLQNKLLNSHDQVALYRAESTCVVTFAGTNDLADWGKNLDVRTVQQCGGKLHEGFFNALVDVLQSKEWNERIASHLASLSCSEVIATGFSLGGAIASVLAGCANSRDGLAAIVPETPVFTVDSLYTFGAPGVSEEPLENWKAWFGCFGGTRVVNYDTNAYDPVPLLTSIPHLTHPKLELEVLENHSSGSDWEVRKKIYACSSTEAGTFPQKGSLWNANVGLHAIPSYIDRLTPFVEGN